MGEHFMASVKADVFDAFRSVFAPDSRLFLYEADPSTGRGATGIDFGNTLPGEVLDGWKPERRRFDRDGAPLPFTVLVACQEPYTAALVKRTQAFLIADEGEATGDLYRATKQGVVAIASEAAYRLAGTLVRSGFPVPEGVVPVEVNYGQLVGAQVV